MTRAFRTDSAELAPLEMLPSGFARGEARLTRTGVFPYRFADGSERRELRHPDDVFDAKSIATLRMVPITDGHPDVDVTIENVRDLSCGTVGSSVTIDGQRFLRADICLTDPKVIEGVKSGRPEVSCGYWADIEEVEGEYEGERYDSRQRNITYNHLAANIDAGRAGPDVKIRADRRDAVLVTTSKSNTTSARADAKGESMTRKIKIHDVDCEVTDQTAQAVEAEIAAYKQKLAELEAQLASMKGSVDMAEGEAVEAKKELDAARAKADGLAEQVATLTKQKTDAKEIAKAARARVSLLRIADQALPKDAVAKLDDMTDDEIRKAVIVEVRPSAKLDDKSAEYIAARFDDVVESLADNPREARDTRDARDDEREPKNKNDDADDDLDPQARYHADVMGMANRKPDARA